ncbi:PAS domain S-box protein [Halomontanus rarus]|uniref:PAS domain-containing sensor histidine kinase n=1 Tax=Halomontanus rarus TaxID=3034020 RepID=UPI00293B8768|nr:PAS domain S-box protein [Halovivax sp. KZCA124]
MTNRVEGTGGTFWPDAETDEALQHYQTLVNTIDDGVYQLDTENRFVAVNDIFAEATEYNRESHLGVHVSQLFEDNETTDLEQTIQDLREVEEDDAAILEQSIRTPEGDLLSYELRLRILEFDGEFRGTIGIVQNITGQQQRERTLLDRVFESSPIGISAVSTDGEIITSNDRAIEMVGGDPDDPDETYEASAWEVYDANGEPIPPQERTFGRVVETGEPVTDFEAQVERRDGGRVWLSFNGVPVFDSDGELTMVVITYEDVTERKERERQLRRERAQTEKLLQTAPVAIAVHDADGETLLANQRAQDFLGLSEDEIIEEPDDADEWDLYDASGEPLSSNETPSARVLSSGEPVFEEEIAIEPPNGERRWFHVNAASVFDSEGTLERVITAGEDVTELKKRERQLERRTNELESELGEIFGRISDAFYALDEEYHFMHVNERAEDYLQHSEEELLGKNLWETFPELVDTNAQEQFRTAMNTQNPTSFERYYDSLDRWLEASIYPSTTGLSVYFQDITERKEREQELVTYETIVETIPDGIYVADEEGCFTMVNEGYTELTGYSREELLGEHASLVIDEETIEQASEIRTAMADGEVENPMLEAPVQTAGGDYIPTEVTFATLPAENNNAKRVGVIRDITERKEHERALEESEHRYRTLVEHFPNGAVGLYDEDLRYTAAGGEFLNETGISHEEVIGETIYERYPARIVDEIEPHFHAALEGETNVFEVTYNDRHLLAHTVPVRNADGEVSAGMLTILDITEREETRRKLEESNERLEQFAYAASHDLQEPLRMISSYLQLVDRRYSDELDEDGQEFIEFAVDGAHRMQNMIEGLLTYSRVETQGDPFGPIDLDRVLEEALTDLQVKIEESDAEIEAESLPYVHGDASQLRQVFENLLKNAITYSGDEPPSIEVTAEKNDSEWVLSVHDEGIGIDYDNTQRIFDVFQRAHGHEGYAGTGIGLALCERIVERHGGDIWVKSEVGEGSTFSFTLPSTDDCDE